MRLTNKLLLQLIVLLVLSVLLLGCAVRSPGSTAVPVLPRTPALPPSLAKPVSPESYSDRAQRNTQAWQQKLTASESR